MYAARMSALLRIAPSILSADLGRLAEEIEEVQAGGADWIHVDIVDGHFAPFLSFGPATVAAARKATDLTLDIHLMIDNPDAQVEAFANAGADILTVHPTATPDLAATLASIHELGARAGVAVAPDEDVRLVAPVIQHVDVILALCVRPGRSGQSFLAGQLDRIRYLRRLADESGREIDLEVDGGISRTTAGPAVGAGARVLVTGSKVFGAEDRAAAIAELRGAGLRALCDESV